MSLCNIVYTGICHGHIVLLCRFTVDKTLEDIIINSDMMALILVLNCYTLSIQDSLLMMRIVYFLHYSLHIFYYSCVSFQINVKYTKQFQTLIYVYSKLP